MKNFVGTYFGTDTGLYLFIGGKTETLGCFLVRRRSRREGGVYEKKGETKALRLKLVLVYCLDETGAIMMKLNQVSG